MSKCEKSIKLVETVLTTLNVGGAAVSCGINALSIGAVCDAAGGGPEDPIADLVCIDIAVAYETVCGAVGISAMQNDIPLAARLICEEMKICHKTHGH